MSENSMKYCKKLKIGYTYNNKVYVIGKKNNTYTYTYDKKKDNTVLQS